MFYKKHVFFCTNQKTDQRQCCQMSNAEQWCHYTKTRIKASDAENALGIRVSRAGCLGRCALGPTIVIYPEGVWYTYHNQADIDELIDRVILRNESIDRLKIAL